MTSQEIARAFARVADLMEIDGADRFRVNSYRKAARTLKDFSGDLTSLAKQSRLTDLDGIGKSSAARIANFLDTGRLDVLEELEGKLPEGLPALLDVPGLGPKKVALAHNELGIAGLDDLKRAISSGEFAKLPGLGAASVKKISEGIAFLEHSGDRTPLGIALPIAEALAERLREIRGVDRVEIAGSLRRGCETIGDVDLLCVANDGAEIIQTFVAFDGVERVLAAGATKGSVTIGLDKNRELQIDLRVVQADSLGAALQYFTGSKEHNVRLREIAVRKKLRLNEYGLYDGERSIAGAIESDIYEKLNVAYAPPELRQDRGEFDEGFSNAPLVTLRDIRGDLHMHSTASDGRCSIVEMAEAARALGYEYIAMCDHSKSSVIAHGLSIDRMEEHILAIRDADAATEGITILVGTECDILPDGSLDYPDEILRECDWVVASIHSAMGSGGTGKLSATDRTVAAMENPYVSAIGHPTGRLIGRRAPMKMDMAAVIAAAAKTKTMLETNASWHRLDLKDLHVRQARESGVMLTVNTDAHHTDQLAQMRYGIMTARRGGALPVDVANCLTIGALRERIASKRNA